MFFSKASVGCFHQRRLLWLVGTSSFAECQRRYFEFVSSFVDQAGTASGNLKNRTWTKSFGFTFLVLLFGKRFMLLTKLASPTEGMVSIADCRRRYFAFVARTSTPSRYRSNHKKRHILTSVARLALQAGTASGKKP